MYLFELSPIAYNYESVKKELDQLLLNTKITLDKFITGSNIDSSLRFYYDTRHVFIIGEFPGNCSSLVLHYCEHLAVYPEEFKEILEFAIAFCTRFEYACLFMTGTNNRCRDFLMKEYDFKLASSFMNPHSDNINYFVQKFIFPDANTKIEPEIEE